MRFGLAAAAFIVTLPFSAMAQETVRGPVRILVPFADGASFAAAEFIVGPIASAIDQPAIVERKPGATGRVAAETLKNAPRNGTTLLLAPIVVPVLNPLVFKNLRYDPLRDFAPVAQVATFRYALAVEPNHPARTLREFAAWAKVHPTQATFGTPGAGSVPHFLGVMVSQAADVELVHVPYLGAAPMTADLMGGHIACGIDALANLIEFHRAGKILILATSGTERAPLAPAVPTFREQGFAAIEATGWIALYAPAGTPTPIIDRLSKAVNEALHTPSIREKYLALGVEPTGTTPEELAAIMATDTARWAPIIRTSGFVAE